MFRFKFLAFLISLYSFLPLYCFGYSQGESTLALYNWPDYINEDILKRFKDEFEVNIEVVHYETDELKNEHLIHTNGGEGLDLIIGSGYSIREYLKKKWLSELAPGDLPNKLHLSKKWQKESKLDKYGVPYLWGVMGIAYRTDFIKTEVTSWLDLLKPTEDLRKKIIMINDSKDILGIALKALGYSMNSVNTGQLAEAESLLIEQRPFVSKYGYLVIGKGSSLVKGSTWMAPMYNGDGLVLSGLNPNIRFTVPKEGTNVWVDYIVIPKHSKNKQLAHQFINFLLEPEIAALNASLLNFASPNESAKAYLSDEMLENPNIYPHEQVLNKSESHATFTSRDQRRRNQIFLNLIP